ncbi:MAG TPA: glutamate synthase subunit beta [Tepidisphaeraceae bacterium]|jgi:glutamate synthase (NADPH/NADH) small chain
MGKPTGFKEFTRETPKKRPAELRVLDWNEIYIDFPEDKLRKQGARCMDCGVPFCNNGCPLGNLIPDWNDLVYRGRWKEAYEALLKTNNFPEWTGRICPAPCEEACVLSINDKPVTIKTIEQSISDRAWKEGWIKPQIPTHRTGKKVAVIGSGPAGLAAAEQLNKAGHWATVYERAERPGGLLLYGIPDFKMDKRTVHRRIQLMEEAGIKFVCKADIGNTISVDQLRREYDAIILATGATRARDLSVPGRELDGVHVAMNYLPQPTQEALGDAIFAEQKIDAFDKHVVIIGAGDTAADCLGTANRQKAKSVTQLNIYPKPPEERDENTAPWPYWPNVFRTSPAHEEGGVREWAVLTKGFKGENGKMTTIVCARQEVAEIRGGRQIMREIPGTEFELPCDLCLIAIGFSGPEAGGLIDQLGLGLDARGNIVVDEHYATSVPGVYATGDCRRGQSLVVWAISEGRCAAAGVDEFLMGKSDLPTLKLF